MYVYALTTCMIGFFFFLFLFACLTHTPSTMLYFSFFLSAPPPSPLPPFAIFTGRGPDGVGTGGREPLGRKDQGRIRVPNDARQAGRAEHGQLGPGHDGFSVFHHVQIVQAPGQPAFRLRQGCRVRGY